jgi:hypothetical protein
VLPVSLTFTHKSLRLLRYRLNTNLTRSNASRLLDHEFRQGDKVYGSRRHQLRSWYLYLFLSHIHFSGSLPFHLPRALPPIRSTSSHPPCSHRPLPSCSHPRTPESLPGSLSPEYHVSLTLHLERISTPNRQSCPKYLAIYNPHTRKRHFDIPPFRHSIRNQAWNDSLCSFSIRARPVIPIIQIFRRIMEILYHLLSRDITVPRPGEGYLVSSNQSLPVGKRALFNRLREDEQYITLLRAQEHMEG